MAGMVKNVFLVLMGAVLAFTLYVLFFGAESFDGSTLGASEGVNVIGEWKGILWYAAGAIEEPISLYYYKYCLVPAVHKDDGVDEALGMTVNRSYYNTQVDAVNGVVGYAPTEYSTGWR